MCLAILDDVYMTINSGKKYYYMNYNDTTANVEEFLDKIGVKSTSKKTENEEKTNTEENEVENSTIDENQNNKSVEVTTDE